MWDAAICTVGKTVWHFISFAGTSHCFPFSPWADIGGAIKVNADITDCLLDKKPLIIFSKKPKNNGHRELFNIPGVQIMDLHEK